MRTYVLICILSLPSGAFTTKQAMASDCYYHVCKRDDPFGCDLGASYYSLHQPRCFGGRDRGVNGAFGLLHGRNRCLLLSKYTDG